MLNIRLTLQYDGTNYAGWQIQRGNNGKKSIQEVLEGALRRILREKIRLTGSGRTDAGVHSKAQVANFKTNSKIPLKNLQRALNSILPKDISVKAIEKVCSSFHSRFDAKYKIYRYQILNSKHPDPFLKDYSYFYPYKLDIGLMRREARCLVGRHDFSSFRASVKKDRPAVRTIKSLKIARSGDVISIDIKADGFLYNMVRNIAGTLIEIGRKRFKKGDLRRILGSKDRKMAGPTAPARGLFLIKVGY